MKIITTNIAFIWAGLESAIPSNWERVTQSNGKYIKGSGVQTPLATGGNATHVHGISGTHEHLVSTTHVHSITLGGLTAPPNDRAGSDTLSDHTHGTFNSASASGGKLQGVSASYGAVSNDPPYYEVIFIKPVTATSKLPNNVIVLTEENSIVDFNECDGTSGTPDLRGKFLKGAGVGVDAGATGGSTINIHTLIHSSNHVVTAHSHGNITSNSTTSPQICDSWGGNPTGGRINWNNRNHTHTVSLNSAVDTIDNTDPDITCTEVVEPLYKKLLALQHASGGDITLPKGVIGFYSGDLAKIPFGWDYLDGSGDKSDFRNYYVKVADSSGQIGDVGGSNTHEHLGDTHTHTSLGHVHGVTQDNHATKNFSYDAGHNTGYSTEDFTDEEDLHSTSCSSTTVLYENATTNALTASNEPEHVVMALVRFNGKRQGASILNAFVRG